LLVGRCWCLQTLAGLVIADHPGGRVGAERMSTREVVEQYIAPRTAGLSCRFSDILPDSCVGLPRYHVSHRCAHAAASCVNAVG
jgi:hypothetical protein